MKFNTEKTNGWIRTAIYIIASIFAFGACYQAMKTKVDASVIRLDKVENIVSTDHDTVIELKTNVKHIKDGVEELLKIHQVK